MKNVQVIDGAANCTYSIYAFTDEEFLAIFPAPEQGVEFIEDALERLGPEALDEALEEVWARPVRKPEVIGIHGTLFYELAQKKRFYPSKSERDVSGPPNAPFRAAPTREAPVRSAPLRSAPRRSAPSSLARIKLARRRLAPASRARDKFA